MAFDATVGGSSATSNITVERADEILSGRLHSSAWTSASTADKQAALQMATRVLASRVCLNGLSSSVAQALPFPRTGLLDRNGNPIADDVIPIAWEEATAELALMLLSSDLTVESDAAVQGLTRLEVGSVKLAWAEGGATYRDLPTNVRLLIPESWICADTSARVLLLAF